MPAFSTSRRCRNSRPRSGTRSSPSTCRRRSTPRGSRCRRCSPTSGDASSTSRRRTALVASPFKSAYVAAKHGMLGLTKVTALEVAEAGITCNAICPGYVYTPLVEAQIDGQAKSHGIPREQVIRDVLLAQQPNKRFATVDELGALTVFLASDAAASITGSSISGRWRLDRTLSPQALAKERPRRKPHDQPKSLPPLEAVNKIRNAKSRPSRARAARRRRARRLSGRRLPGAARGRHRAGLDHRHLDRRHQREPSSPAMRRGPPRRG